MILPRPRPTRFALALLVWQLGVCAATAEPGDDSQRYEVTKLVESLDNPCGLALRPGSVGESEGVFFSESGAGRVLMVDTKSPRKIVSVIEGFPVGTWELDPTLRVGPLGLAFIKRTNLAVGTGGLGREKDQIRVYDLPTERDQGAASFEDASDVLGPLEANKRSQTGESGFYSLAVRPGAALYATSTGDPKQQWLSQATITSNRAHDLQLFIATAKSIESSGLLAATLNPARQRGYLAVGLRGKADDERDSVLAFFSPHSGRIALQMPAGLFDLAGLAYSATGQLYAVDFAWHDPNAGGVYRLDEQLIDGEQRCRPTLIAKVERPSSLVFASSGELYVTAFGATDEDSPSGVLLRIQGNF